MNTATDILDVVPVLLGFIPTESLVVIYLDTVNGRQQVGMTARLDLPLQPPELTGALQLVEHHASRYDAMILVVYSVDSSATESTLRFLLNRATDSKITVALSASLEGWAKIGVDGATADHPTHRKPYPDDTSELATAFVAAGLQSPQQSRDDLKDSLKRPSPADAQRFAMLLADSAAMTSEQVTAWLQQWTSGGWGGVVDPAEAAVLVASVQDIDTRDVAWAAITCPDAYHHIDLWRRIALLVDGAPALPVLGLLGMAAWIGDQGALANLVLDRAATTEGYSEYTLFEMLHTVLEAKVDRRQWDSMRLAMSTSSAT